MNTAPSEAAGERVMVPLACIRTDPAAQPRAKVRAGAIREYAAAMTEQLAEGGLRFPPVILFSDGRDYWLGDGYHRVLAAQKVGLSVIAAEVRPGTQRDALLYGVSANSAHGLPRTNADKRKVTAFILADPEWSQWSDREIARRCQVHHQFVSQMRRGLSGVRRQIRERKVRRRGTVYDMKTVPSHAATSADRVPPPAGAAVATDALGVPLPESRAKVFTAAGDFQEAKDLFDRLAQVLDRIAQGPAGALYRQDMVQTVAQGQVAFACPGLRVARGKLVATEPHCAYCPRCQQAHPGRSHPTCKLCGGRSWTTRAAFESCPTHERQPILEMRTANPK